MDRVVLPLEVDRYVPWVQSIPILGEAIPTSADIRLGVALTRDLAAEPALALSKATVGQRINFDYSGTDTLANHVAAGRLPAVPEGYSPSESTPLTVIGIFGPAPSSGWAPYPAERGEPLVMQYDIWLTRTAFLPAVIFTGPLTILPGVIIA